MGKVSLWLSVGVGLTFGSLCSWLRLPLPAPTALEGVLCIAALWVGFTFLGGK